MDSVKDFYDDVPISVWEKILDSTMSYHWASSDGPASVFENPVLSLLPHIGNAKKILDVGCGFGAVAKILLDDVEGLEITGVTNSQVQYDYLAENPIENFNVVLADFNDWESNETYDLILFFESFTHFGDDILEKLSGVAPKILIRDYTWDWNHFSIEWGMHFRTKSEFESLFSAAGFSVSEIFESDNDFWRTAGTFWLSNIDNNLTEAEKEIYHVDLIKNLFEAGLVEGHVGARVYMFSAELIDE